ncbi:MAG TPA: hypothetical protein VJA21_05670 [Verrucomicrobiae bacterium]
MTTTAWRGVDDAGACGSGRKVYWRAEQEMQKLIKQVKPKALAERMMRVWLGVGD